MIKMIEKLTEQFIGIQCTQNCWEHLHKGQRARTWSEKDRLQHNCKVTKQGSSIAKIPNIPWCTFRAIQGHTGGNMIAPESDESRRDSVQVERICTPYSLFFQRRVYPWNRTHCGWTREKREDKPSSSHIVEVKVFCVCISFVARNEGTHNQEPTKMYDSFQAKIDTDKISQYDCVSTRNVPTTSFRH